MNRKQISFYPRLETLKKLEDYCLENGITGLNKEGEEVPRIGTAVLAIIEGVFSGEISLKPSGKKTQRTNKEVLELIKKLDERLTKLEQATIIPSTSGKKN